MLAALDDARDDTLDERAPVALTKNDVEDMEPNVLCGAATTLRTHHPIIAFEQNQPAFAECAEETEGMAVLRSEGYEMRGYLECRHGLDRTKLERLEDLILEERAFAYRPSTRIVDTGRAARRVDVDYRSS